MGFEKGHQLRMIFPVWQRPFQMNEQTSPINFVKKETLSERWCFESFFVVGNYTVMFSVSRHFSPVKRFCNSCCVPCFAWWRQFRFIVKRTENNYLKISHKAGFDRGNKQRPKEWKEKASKSVKTAYRWYLLKFFLSCISEWRKLQLPARCTATIADEFQRHRGTSWIVDQGSGV